MLDYALKVGFVGVLGGVAVSEERYLLSSPWLVTLNSVDARTDPYFFCCLFFKVFASFRHGPSISKFLLFFKDLPRSGLENPPTWREVQRREAALIRKSKDVRLGYQMTLTVGFREVETTVFDPASVFLSTH